jgi:hypothetical protein
LGRPLELSPAAVSFDARRLGVTRPDVQPGHQQSKSQGCGFAIAPAQGVNDGVLRHAAYLYGNTGGIDPLEG